MTPFCICQLDCKSSPVKGKRYARGHAPKPELKPCACGQCDEMVKGTYAHGHYARVHNPSSLPEVKIKRRATAKRRIAEGERSFAGWNKGLSKETDERVASYGQKNSELLQADSERLKRRSENCSKQWEEGRITPNPKGPGSSRWKGGSSSIQAWCRASLYHAWSRPIMKRDGWSCQRCEATGPLCVHHDQERFAAILQKILARRQVPDLTVEEKMQVVDDVVKYHLDNSVSGITLCEPCHDAIHAVDPDLD